MPEAVQTTSTGEEEIIKAYNLAQKFAPGIIKKFNLQGQIDPEDIVGLFITNFIDKGFLDKFNPKVMSFDRYVWQGLRNSAIQAVRRKKERTSIQAMGGEEGDLGDILPAEAPKSREFVEELIDDIEDFKFGYGKTAILMSEPTDPSDKPEVIAELPSSARSIMKMLSMGYKPFEIAQKFGVSPGTISGAMKRIKTELKAVYPERFVEAILHIPEGMTLFDSTLKHFLG